MQHCVRISDVKINVSVFNEFIFSEKQEDFVDNVTIYIIGIT